MKIGCVIQGDVRRGTSQILKELPLKFDFTVLSTWTDQNLKVPSGNYSIILNEKPAFAGLNNRNYQRLSSAKGIHAAKKAGCDFILKWRTDMLPDKLNVKQLIEWANYKVPKGVSSRVVMPAFRNLSVEPDCFSSIPDLFAFGHVDQMEMLWGDSGFDYSRNMNLPSDISYLMSKYSLDEAYLANLFSPESELYSIFRSRLNSKLNIELDHSSIALNYFRLFDHHKLRIFWFDNMRGFRSIAQAWEHPWWTESSWENGNSKVVPFGYPISGLSANIRKFVSPMNVWIEKKRQAISWKLRA
jgi:hypothetical protein